MTNSPRRPTIIASMVSGCWLDPRAVSGRSVPQRDGACYDAAVCAREASDHLDMLRSEAAISTQLLPVHLLEGLTADLQALGQFPHAHSLRPLHPNVLPLLRGQAGPPARETALGSCLNLALDRAVPDRVPPPIAEGEHHRELELTGGHGRVEAFLQGTKLYSRPVQALDHLQPAGKPCKWRR